MNYSTLSAALVVACVASASARADEGFFDSNGVKIRYVTAEPEGAGNGDAAEAVVLIHGWMADSSMWGRDAAGKTKLKASPGFRVIALDCRGHGKSDTPHEVEKYGPEMGEDVVRLLDHLKIEKAHLVGYSSGAYLAGYVAAKYPTRVLSVVYAGQAPLLKAEEHTRAGEKSDASGSGKSGGGVTPSEGVKKSDTPKPVESSKPAEGAKPTEGTKPGDGGKPSDAATDGKKADGASTPGGSADARDGADKTEDVSEVEIFARAVDEGRDLGSYIIAVTPAGRPVPSEENASTIAKYMFKGKDVKALAAAGRGFKHLGVTVEELKKCAAPALFIHGGNEGEAVKSHVAAVRERLGGGAGGNGELKIIEGGDHMTTLANPEFGAAVLEFLTRAKGK